jgi:UDP-N-acetylmuramoylalanine--D-glutamate ligase
MTALALLSPASPVLILGLGSSGLAMARWCARHGEAEGQAVVIADTRAAPPGLDELRREWPQARFITGPLDAALLDSAPEPFAAVYRSPGLPPFEIAALTQAAQARGIPVRGELDLFGAALAALGAERGYAPAVLAVTGTNGKTTVTSLTVQLVERAGRSVRAAGNIGPTLLDTLQAALDTDALPQVWVLELSSFQLDAAQAFEPTAATVLNLTQDHLDWHDDMDAYARAKAKVFGTRGTMVLNRDDPLVWAMRPADRSGSSTPGKGLKARAKQEPPRNRVSFGADLPAAPGDYGLQDAGGMTWLLRALTREEAGEAERRGSTGELHIQRLMPAGALRIRGRHNALNALAALALAEQSGCALAPMLYGLREYRGEPHRVEPVALLDGVEYFDDSKGTNVGATVAALQGLGAQQRVVAILGGDGKGQDFAPLAEPLARFARGAVLIGRDAPVIEQAIQDALAQAGLPLIHAGDMPDAVAQARRLARPGDAVLLSPACASFDMFRDYAHRAAAFREAVAELAREQGIEPCLVTEEAS